MKYNPIYDLPLSTATQLGEDAYLEDKNLSDNPYPDDSPYHFDWLSGFYSKKASDPLAILFEDEEEHEVEACHIYDDAARAVTKANHMRKDLQALAPSIQTVIEKVGSLTYNPDISDTKAWKGNCYSIAMHLLAAAYEFDDDFGTLLKDGVLCHGKWAGPVDARSIFANNPLSNHGWIQCPNGIIIDPTLWVFENKEPYIYVGTAENYDQTGQMTTLLKDRNFTGLKLSGAELKPLRGLEEDHLDQIRQMTSKISVTIHDHFIPTPVIFWLANRPLIEFDGKHAKIFRSIIEADLGNFIPRENMLISLEQLPTVQDAKEEILEIYQDPQKSEDAA